MITVKRYGIDLKNVWNQFVKEAKNGLFLFDRQYMEYHADRFPDHSLMFYFNEELLAVLPASQSENILNSHGGLTYGGFVLSKRASALFLLNAFEEMKRYLRSSGIDMLHYKAVPYIYHRLPSQEDSYMLFRNNAMLYRRDLSSVIDLSEKPAYTKGTKYNLSKARKNNLRIELSNDYDQFMEIEERILASKYGTKPTHTKQEIRFLADSFPDNIKLYMVFRETNCLGGTIIYQTETVAHTQYIGITDEGKEIGALDILTDFLLQKYSATHRYFSFGISTTDEGNVVNEGLLRNKESFGARAIVHDFYKIAVTQ